jgi:succinoglycan biosynthesis transport protein ExoP
MEQLDDTDASTTDESLGLPWRDIVRSAFRHRKMIIGFAIVGALVMGMDKFLEPPMYEAQSTLMLIANRADVKVSPDERSVTQVDRIDETLVNSEATWFRSEGVLRKVLEPWRAKVEGDRGTGLLSVVVDVVAFPFRLPGIVYRRLHGAPDPTIFDGWVDSVQKRLVVSPVRLSSVIEMSYTDPTPEFAAEVLNSLIAYRMNRQKNFSKQDEAVGFYDEQSRLLADRVRAAEEALQAFYENEGIVGGPEERKGLRDRLTEIHTMLGRARTESAEARVRVSFLQKALQQVPRRVEAPGNPGGSIQTRVLELMLERSKLLASYAPTSVKIVDLDHQIAEAKRMLREESKLIAENSAATNPTYSDLEKELIQTQAQLAALEARSAALAREEQGYVEQMRKSVRGSATLEQLEMDLERAKESHRTYAGKREAARFSSALDASQILNITVAVPPAVPTTPVQSRQGVSGILGALAGLVAGIGLAYVRDLIDPTVKSAAEVGRLTGMPVLGEVSS